MVKRSLAFALSLLTCGCTSALVRSGIIQPTPERLDQKKGFKWQYDSTQNFKIRVEKGSRSSGSLDSLKAGLEAALLRVQRQLQVSDDPEPIHAFAVDSVTRVRALLGRDVDGRAFYGTRVFAFVVGPNWQSTARHELTHVVTRNAWDGDPDQWINEGVATYIGDHYHGHDVHRLVRERLVTSGRVVPLVSLARNFDDHPDEISYLQAASVAKFIIQRYGLNVLRAVWADGLDGIQRTTGTDLITFEREWRSAVDRS